MKNFIEFVSYSGGYPNLCSGRLEFKVNGTPYEIGPGCFYSGGTIRNNYTEIIKGNWEINFDNYPELKQYAYEITQMMNDNVPKGCCGGCI